MQPVFSCETVHLQCQFTKNLLFLTRRLLTELDSYKPEASKPGDNVAKVGGGDASHITYQLYYRPEQAKFSHNARVYLFTYILMCYIKDPSPII